MTSDELEMKIGDIDPRLGIKPSLDPKVITFNDEPIYSFIEKLFSFNGLIHFIQRGDVGASKWFALQRTILEYWTSKDSQTISKDSKKENGSTMPFEDDISNDSQKKPVLRGLYTKKETDSILEKYKKKQENVENELKELGLESNEKIKRHFIDYLLDNYFNPRIQTMLGETTKIEILDPTLTLICTIDFSKEEPVSLNISGTKDADFLKMLIGLSANILQMLKDLDHFKQLNQLKEDDNEH